MLDQISFSEVVKNWLEEFYPQFLFKIETKPDNSFDCSFESPSKKFSVWIATYSCEITVGLESHDGNSDCHTHFTPYEMEDITSVLENLSLILQEIFSGKLFFYHSSLTGYSWTTNDTEILKKKQKGESIEFFSWDAYL
jgi:hypothetical protein